MLRKNRAACESVQEVSKQVVARRMIKLRKSLMLKGAGSRVRTDDLLITNRNLLQNRSYHHFRSVFRISAVNPLSKLVEQLTFDARVVTPYCHNRARKLSGNCPTPRRANANSRHRIQEMGEPMLPL